MKTTIFGFFLLASGILGAPAVMARELPDSVEIHRSSKSQFGEGSDGAYAEGGEGNDIFAAASADADHCDYRSYRTNDSWRRCHTLPPRHILVTMSQEAREALECQAEAWGDFEECREGAKGECAELFSDLGKRALEMDAFDACVTEELHACKDQLRDQLTTCE